MTEKCTERCMCWGERRKSFHGNRLPAKRSMSKADLEKHKRIIGDLAASKIFFSLFMYFLSYLNDDKKADMNSAIILLRNVSVVPFL